MSRLDLIVFGATGFTGKYTVKNLMKMGKSSSVTWGVAGRNRDKLEKVLKEMAQSEGDYDVSKVPIVIAELSDEKSLEEMAKQAKVVINCCGPYRFYGEPVVKACIAAKTHHVDVSGEPQYMERMQLEYHDKAKENGVYVVSACGFDSIPADMGVVFLRNQFEGEVNSVEIFMESWVSGKKTGSTVHYGTWESAVYGVGMRSELKPIRKKLFPKPLPSLKPRLLPRFLISKPDAIEGRWCLPFPGADKPVVKRSQYYFYEHENQRPIQVGTYVGFPSLVAAIMVVFAAAVFGLLSKFDYGRKLLLQYPKQLSFGFASHEGPPEDEAENTHFVFTFSGEGWKERLAEPTDSHTEAPNKRMVTKVSGKNPGYGATCVFLIVSALSILEEKDKMPDEGGVYPPGAAFAKTSMIKRLGELGVKFEVLSSN